MKFSRRELALVLGVMVVGWVVLLLVLSKWQRSQPPQANEPDLIHYPGQEDVPEQTSQSINMRRYWFRLHEDYPSQSVYQFYQGEYRKRGWRRLGRGEPQWFRRTDGGKLYDLFHAMWLSPDRLFQVELQMTSEVRPIRERGDIVSEERMPGIEVYVTQRRALSPSLVSPPVPEGRTPVEIEVE
ncbi:MAG: hypothetical protein MUQ26_07765 [Armatimonadetes bacterium]|nr:hypothetical protein [Armatimonadota bacterium]